MPGQKLVIEGGKPLSGEIKVQGAKNSSLPILAASLLCSGESVLKNCPMLSDVYASCRILNRLGCKCRAENNMVIVDSSSADKAEIPDEMMREMRSSIIFMGALLGKFGYCSLSYPGGCELGPRPIDMHLDAVRKMGASVNDEFGVIRCRAEKGLHGAKISLKYPSVGATENIMLAAVFAKGETIIYNAAREPEIIDLGMYLNKCGAVVKGAGGSTIVIEGRERLHGCIHNIMPDRIAAATYISAVAATRGEINILNFDATLAESFLPVFEQMGCDVYVYDGNIYVGARKPLKGVGKIITMPHPGFPTDAQAVVMAVLCRAKGSSIFEETIFESRYRHVNALVKMGADIKTAGKAAVIEGVRKMYGAKVEATDLRGGAAMAVAALGAEGITEISELRYIDRGYESIENVLTSLGASVKRV